MDVSDKGTLNSQQIAQMTWIKDPSTGRMVNLRPTLELVADYRAWLETDCTHPEYAMRKVKPNNAGWMYRNQCVTCGSANGQWVKKSLIPDADAVPEALLDQLMEFEKQRFAELRKMLLKHLEIQSGQGNAEYAVYLRSPAWKAKREKVLLRANSRCEGCGENAATQVHHLSYQHIYNEFLWELVAICDGCHDRAHEDFLEENEPRNEISDNDDNVDFSEYDDEDQVE